MATFPFQDIDSRWQKYWKSKSTFRHSSQGESKPKYFVMDMFPYPSGSGLHVGHPLGYIATDIIAKFKKLKGYNVLHPMGFDSFGLPAENYAIETGTHPAITTDKNIARYKEQLEMLGLGYDDQSEFRTSDPAYYRWTQWIFLQLFDSWYDYSYAKARKIQELTKYFSEKGTEGLHAAASEQFTFSAETWNAYSHEEQQKILLNYRLAFISYTPVNWCPALGTVLANEEVKDGLSERGGHPVIRKPMRQWSLRITAYADRLLEGLDRIDWSDALKEMQRNWIGKSTGLEILFPFTEGKGGLSIFTTRPDTLFGVTFVSIAPEHELAQELLKAEFRSEGISYIEKSKARSERDRMADTRQASGVFTGSFVTHPFTGEKIPVWIADYVLAGYGTGAVMAVPAHDDRDFIFAHKFNLPLKQVIKPSVDFDLNKNAWTEKSGQVINSDLLDGYEVVEAIEKIIEVAEAKGLGKRKVNYRFRDAIFSRQRYWGEPIPIIFKEDIPYAVAESDLPVKLPEVSSYTPTGTGESPLAGIADWVNLPDGRKRETNTMPGWAGSSWYFLRYFDSQNTEQFCDFDKSEYWMNVDLYIGGTEHAVGHLLYARFWTKVLFDLGYIHKDEPFQKLVNQGMILGSSFYIKVYKDELTEDMKFRPVFVNQQHATWDETTKSFFTETIFGKSGKENYLDTLFKNTTEIKILNSKLNEQGQINTKDIFEILDANGFRSQDSVLLLEKDNENFAYLNSGEPAHIKPFEKTDKMSKSIGNVVNPDDMCSQYGADTFRMYEMFLGPLEQYKPWNTNGITGVHAFLKKLWNLLHADDNTLVISESEATREELRLLHGLIRKIEEDIEKLSFNTSIPAFMIFTSEMQKLKCTKRSVWEPALICLAPYAPHISEEIWSELGNTESIFHSVFPKWEEKYLQVDEINYPVQVNGKTSNFILTLPAGLDKATLEESVKTHISLPEILKGRELKKLIAIPGRIVNLVVE